MAIKMSQVGFGIAHPAGAVWHLGSRSVIRDYGSSDPETIFTQPQHCFPHPCTQRIYYPLLTDPLNSACDAPTSLHLSMPTYWSTVYNTILHHTRKWRNIKFTKNQKIAAIMDYKINSNNLVNSQGRVLLTRALTSYNHKSTEPTH